MVGRDLVASRSKPNADLVVNEVAVVNAVADARRLESGIAGKDGRTTAPSDYQHKSVLPSKFDPPRIIRETMEDVEQIARFAAPKYLACYQDVLALHLAKDGEKPAIPTDTLTMMLELGVSSATEVSVMNLGISRAGAVAVAELTMADVYNRRILAWLRDQNLEQLAVPVLVRGETRRAALDRTGSLKALSLRRVLLRAAVLQLRGLALRWVRQRAHLCPRP